ncbi:MAG: FecR domain-containing protein [Chitinophagaceae bacterium]|nr:FecR domain-containing protein [Chitinophagaceae bacterium]
MAPEPQRIYYLLQAWTSRSATPAEEKELMYLVESGEGYPELAAHIQQLVDYYKDDPELPVVDWEQLYQRILAARPAEPVVRKINRTRWVAAAVIVGLLAVGWWLVRGPGSDDRGQMTDDRGTIANQTDVLAPASNRATLTLADGRTVYLDSTENGALAELNGVKVVKTADGKIVYTGSGVGGPESGLVYNTLYNPRGSKVIDITLSDGSRVWLNAGSSITYPVAFAASGGRNERRVQITGEAYFEVAPDKTKPFYVSKGDMEVMVLGTHFNVNAYDDEADIRVTLIEGSVKVSASRLTSDVSRILKPGQQALLTTLDSRLTLNTKPDLEETLAWKNGRFIFTNASIETIMNQVANWYDVEVVYEGKITKTFRGGMPRTLSAASVFRILEETGGVHFEIKGKQVIVRP